MSFDEVLARGAASAAGVAYITRSEQRSLACGVISVELSEYPELSWANEVLDLSLLGQITCHRVECASSGEGTGVEHELITCSAASAMFCGYHLASCCFDDTELVVWYSAQMHALMSAAAQLQVLGAGRTHSGDVLHSQVAELRYDLPGQKPLRAAGLAGLREAAWEVLRESASGDESDVLEALGCSRRDGRTRGEQDVLRPRRRSSESSVLVVVRDAFPLEVPSFGVVLVGSEVCRRGGYIAVALPAHVGEEASLPGGQWVGKASEEEVVIALEILATSGEALCDEALSRALTSARESLSLAAV